MNFSRLLKNCIDRLLTFALFLQILIKVPSFQLRHFSAHFATPCMLDLCTLNLFNVLKAISSDAGIGMAAAIPMMRQVIACVRVASLLRSFEKGKLICYSTYHPIKV